MNKLLLLPLLFIAYTENTTAENINKIIDLSQKSIEELLYLSGKKHLPACFYSKDNFRGRYYCLAAPEMIDLYNIEDKHFNDQISSIDIPKGVQVTIYENDNFNSPYYNLSESIHLSDLEKIGMAGKISAIKALGSPVFCAQNCVVIKENTIKLNNIFDQYSAVFGDINNFVLINVDINNDSNFSVGFMAYPQVVIIGKDLFFYTTEKREPLHMKLNDKANNLSLLFKLNDGQLQFQYVEAKGTESLNTPFWISGYSSDDATDLYITNGISEYDQDSSQQNLNPLILNKTIMAINKHSHRNKRGALGIAGCIGIPLLAIYNYVVHGRCNQLDKLVGINEFSNSDGAGKTLVVASSATPLPQPEQDASPPLNSPPPPRLVLTHLDTNLHNQALTLPAAAKACNTSRENILSTRYPRQTQPSASHCGRWVSEVMADFILLFGSQLSVWTTDYFRQMVAGILNTGNIELPAFDAHYQQIATTAIEQHPDVVERLITNIQSQNITQEDTSHIIRPLIQAFNHTQMNAANYLLQSSNTRPVASSTQAQSLPLGHYELLLTNFVYQEVFPRVLHNGEWITSDTEFEIQIIDDISTITTEAHAYLHTVLAEWHHIYRTHRIKSNKERNSSSQAGCSTASQCLTPRDEIIHAGISLSHSMLSDLESLPIEPNNHWVIVRYNHQIISLLIADSDYGESSEYGAGSVEMAASLTTPNYVLNPEKEGTIRGASTAAFMALARYLKEKGKTKLFSEVITQPSARVKLKLGFLYKDEL
uniref:hypothetical protein n=1 Tax=Yersinia frederiksenii TaxID=29484 RepID=UPI001F4BEF57|nr:hypothetical protein [Yersinia frederiksenii]